MLLRFAACFVVLGVLITVCADAQSLSDQERKEGFQSIFNGKDLTGWVVMNSGSWHVENNSLVSVVGPGRGWLRSANAYEAFILRLEYKVSQGVNSGVFIRATEEGNPAYTGMEIQILDDHGRPATATGSGSVYAAVAPRVNAAKPAGEWNEMEIACIGRMLRVRLNGQLLYVVNLDDPEINAKLPEGQKLKDRVPKGFIGLQNYGNHLEFRNIRIKAFPPKAAEQPK